MNKQQHFSKPKSRKMELHRCPQVLTHRPGSTLAAADYSSRMLKLPQPRLCRARFFQHVVKDGSTTLRVSHLSYSSEGVTLVKTW